jgi:hypothetical protein
VLLPEHAAKIGVHGIEIVARAGDKREFLEAAVGDRALEDQRAVRVDRALFGVELDAAESFRFLTLSFEILVSSFCQPVRCGLPLCINQSAPRTGMTARARSKRKTLNLRMRAFVGGIRWREGTSPRDGTSSATMAWTGVSR